MKKLLNSIYTAKSKTVIIILYRIEKKLLFAISEKQLLELFSLFSLSEFDKVTIIKQNLRIDYKRR